MSGAIITCTCQSTYQDLVYGKQQRVHNFSKNHPTKLGGWRCTVCGKEKDASAGKASEQ